MSDQKPPRNRVLKWLGHVALIMLIPIMCMFGTEASPRLDGPAFVSMAGFAATVLLYVSLLIAERRKMGRNRLMIIPLLACFCLSFVSLFLAEEAVGVDAARFALAALTLLFLSIMFFTVLYWGAQVEALPISIVLAASAGHVGLFLWTGLSSSFFAHLAYGLFCLSIICAWIRTEL